MEEAYFTFPERHTGNAIDSIILLQMACFKKWENGVVVSFGSDSCLEEETANPFLGMYYACVRGNETMCGEQNLPPETESINRKDSLYAYTINGARQLMLEKETGSITAGKSADFIIVDRDILKCPIEELKDTKVLRTYFCGRAKRL